MKPALIKAVEKHRAGDLAGAADDYRQIVRHDPSDADAWLLLGVAELDGGNPAAALEPFERAAKLKPTLQAHLGAGDTLLALGRVGEALAHLEAAHRLDPAHPDPLLRLGAAQTAMGRSLDAAESYRKILRHDPRRADAQHLLGQALSEAGRLAEAIAAFEKAVELEPSRVEHRLALAQTLPFQSRYEEALAQLEQASAVQPDWSDASWQLGRAHVDAGHFQQALAHLHEAARVHPDDARIWTELGRALRGIGLEREALEMFGRAASLAPRSPSAQLDLAMTRLRLHDPSAWEPLAPPAGPHAVPSPSFAGFARPVPVALHRGFEGAEGIYRGWMKELLEGHGHPVTEFEAEPPPGTILFGINFEPRLARIAKERKVPYVCWMIDPAANAQVLDPALVSEYVVPFHFSRADAQTFQSLGYSNCTFLPLAVEDSRLLEEARRAPHKQFELSFVGHCYRGESLAWARYRDASLAGGFSPERGFATVDSLVKRAAEDLTTPLWRLVLEHASRTGPDLFRRLPLHFEAMYQAHPRFVLLRLASLVSHDADREVRLGLARALGPLGLGIWGEGWEGLGETGARIQGPAPREALGAILATSRVCVNVTRRVTDGVNMRAFEIPASGSFQLALHNEDLAAMFEDGREIVLFRTLEEAADKARWFIDHEEARERIARAGHQRYLRDHRLERRFEVIDSTLRRLGIF